MRNSTVTVARSAIAAGIAAALLTVSAGAAHAQTTTVKDRASDVVDLAAGKGQQDTLLGYADSVATGIDLRSMRVKHTKKSVAVTLRFADLSPRANIGIAFRVNGRSKPQFTLTSISSTRAEVRNAADKRRCAVPLTRRTGPRGTVHVVVARSCLASPRKIKVGAAASLVTPAGESVDVQLDVVSDTSVKIEEFDWTRWLKAS